MTRSRWAVLGALVLAAVACSGDPAADTSTTVGDGLVPTSTVQPGDGASDGRRIVVWLTDTRPERVEKAVSIGEGFRAATGISVELVLVEESALAGAMASNAEAGTLPDVVLHPMDLTVEWAARGFLDFDAAQAIVAALGVDTFSPGALDLARYRGRVAAVPTHGWGQVIVYREDLFDAVGLDTPDTFARLEAAAEALHDPEADFTGIAAPSSAGQVFTQHSFEYFAVANGCELTDPGGAVSLDSPRCVEAFDFYTNLLARFGSPAGDGTAETRARYFAGKAGMLVWSTLVMDEMAGLRDAAMPTCPECGTDVSYLARNSGFVAALSGPSGGPAQFWQITNFGIGAGSDTEAAGRLVQYWLSDGYPLWLSTAPERRLPMRRGNAGNPRAYVDEWRMLETGVDRTAALSDFYSPDVAAVLAGGLDEVRRWGFILGENDLVAAIYARLPIAEEIQAVVAGSKTTTDAIAAIQRKVEEEQRLLGTG